jgi:hypothetical protein
MKTYTITLTRSEARTQTRTITLVAEDKADARQQLLALPDGQTEVDGTEIMFTPEAFNTDNGVWHTSDWDIVEAEVDDPDDILS